LASEVWDYSDEENPEIVGKKFALNLYLKSRQDGGLSHDGCVSDLSYPVLDVPAKARMFPPLTANIYWQTCIDDVFPSYSEPVAAVLESVGGDHWWRSRGSRARRTLAASPSSVVH
jgi:hypothetical protein